MKRFHAEDGGVRMAGTTLKSVAKLAGVSVGTVSRVLNNHPNVSAGNREAVAAAIKALDYRPDPVARSLRKLGSAGRIWTGNIGVVFPNTTTAMLKVPFMARMIQGVQSELSDNGYHLIISNTTDPASIPDVVRDEKVEGVLIHGDLSPSLCRQLGERIPAVSMGWNDVSLPLPMVNVNNRGAVVSAVRYLVELGHRRIGFVAKEPEHKDIAERLMGYRESFGPLGLDYDASLESIDQPRGYRGPRVPEPLPPVMDGLVDPLLKLAAPPTALIVPSDWQSIGVYRALAVRGVRIPDDISLIGFDNEEYICHSLVPALTSLEYPAEEIGRQAVRMLVRRMKEGNGERQDTLLVKSVLVVRGSTGRPNL